MAENENGAAPATQPQLKMNILGQFIRDLSFENVVVTKAPQGEIQPEIQVQVSLDAKKRPVEHQYEVDHEVPRHLEEQGQRAMTLFLLELEYGGIFLIDGVPDDQLHPFLMIECPRMLFPFARRIISDVTRDGGFPPLNVDKIDFLNALPRSSSSRGRRSRALPPVARELIRLIFAQSASPSSATKARCACFLGLGDPGRQRPRPRLRAPRPLR